jgi:hypothetical protein
MFDVEKVIRVLGYTVYMILWSPIIVLALVGAPIVFLAIDLRAGRSVADSFKGFKDLIIAIIQHDKEFIQTGKW